VTSTVPASTSATTSPVWYSVDVPRTGTTIRGIKTSKKGVMWIKVN
jgi:hypothetical protein